MQNFLDFEKPVAELEGKIEELRHLTDSGEVNIEEEVAKLQKKVEQLLMQLYTKLTPWQKTQVARHYDRPHTVDYIEGLFEDFTPLAGDRQFAEDPAVIGGLARFKGSSIVVIGNEKGSGTEGRLKHNFGMARPEGYRKAQRLMKLANNFQLPLISFVDTPGAYPGVDAEARGQAEAIARTIEMSICIKIPLISVIIGEGGSGGAMALATANKVLMQEHAIYSVISPEGCASILWRDGNQAEKAAEALKLTADDLLKLGIIDKIIPEPLGGAHRTKKAAINTVGMAIQEAMSELSGIDGGVLKQRRREKFLEMGSKGLG
ncbi:MAG: acetyl-CoA carboxylase carboxyltransferase subunit alpha [Pseudomonadota bacterium]|mgnify:CR=1 FL=1|nr:acetyl-CoA carboxylase carboxyltransferase subunit alpha [Pseudomonadota bacterium]